VGTPTFVFLDPNGVEVARLVGEQTENTLKQALSALRKKPCPGFNLFLHPKAGESTQIPFPASSPPKKDTTGSCETEPENLKDNSRPEECQNQK